MLSGFFSALFRPHKNSPESLKFYVPDGNHQTRFINLIKKSPDTAKFITDKKNPGYFLPVFIHPFLLDSQCNIPFGENVIKYYSEGLDLLLDFSTEALIFGDDLHFFSRQLKKLHEFLLDKKMDSKRIYLLNANSVPNIHYKKWCERHNIENPVNIIGFDFYMYESSQAICKYYEKNDLLNDIVVCAFDPAGKKHVFSCLNLKPKPHRYTIAAKLLDLVPRDKLTLSFLCKANNEEKKELQHFINKLADNNIKEQMEELESQIPITIDYSNIDKLQEDIYVLPEAANVWGSLLLLEDDSRVLLNSYIDIVNETWFTDESCLFFSEKTLRPLVLCKPFMIVGCPFSLQKLHELGLKTFHPVINEEYDTISEPAARMDMILKEIERLSRLSSEELTKLYLELKDILLHNYFHILKHIKIAPGLVDDMFSEHKIKI